LHQVKNIRDAVLRLLAGVDRAPHQPRPGLCLGELGGGVYRAQESDVRL